MVGKLCAELKFSNFIKGHGQGHVIKIYGTIGTVVLRNTLVKYKSPIS